MLAAPLPSPFVKVPFATPTIPPVALLVAARASAGARTSTAMAATMASGLTRRARDLGVAALT